MRSYAVIQLDHEKSVTVDPNSNWKHKKYQLMSQNEAITLELIVVLPTFVSLISRNYKSINQEISSSALPQIKSNYGK